jgi:acyl-CoA thioesterase
MGKRGVNAKNSQCSHGNKQLAAVSPEEPKRTEMVRKMEKKIDLTDPGVAFAMKLVENNPFQKLTQIEIDELDVDHCICHVALRHELTNPNGLAHGGLLFTLADIAASALARADGRNYSTLDANVYYMRNVKEGMIFAEASVIRRGRTTVLVESGSAAKREKN